MAAAAEVQVGIARINGIQGTLTCAVLGANFNPSSVSKSENFKVDSIVSPSGVVIETKIASQRERMVSVEFIPSGTTRADAIAVVTALNALGPLAVVTLGGFTGDTSMNSTFNYLDGGEVVLKRDTYCIANIRLVQTEVAATGGTFAALAIAT